MPARAPRPAPAAAVAAMVAAGLLAAPATPPALAHSEPLNPAVLLATQAANQAEQHVAVVVMKDRQFLPPVVTVRGGGTVWFVWADSEKREHHSPRSSGSTGSVAADLAGTYVPAAPGACFNSEADLGQEIVGEGATYPLTLAWDPGPARVRKSMGFLAGSPLGDVTGAQPFRVCPPGTQSAQGGAAVVPYHCKLHGFQLAGDQGRMKGAIVVLP